MEEWLRSLGFSDRASAYAARLAEHGISDVSELLRLQPLAEQLMAWRIDQPEHARLIAAAVSGAIRSDEAEPAPSYPPGLEPEALPVFLAHAWQEFWQERSHRLKLYLLLDLSELCIRFATAIAVGEAAAHGEGNLAPGVLQELVKMQLTRPTLGNWCGILRETINLTWHADHPNRPAIAALHDMLEDGELKGVFDQRDDGGEEALGRSLLALRNRVYHSGMTVQAAKHYRTLHQPRLEKILSELMSALAGRRAVALAEGNWYDLTGLEPSLLAQELIPATGPSSGGVFLLDSQGALLSLWPLAIFEKIGAGAPEDAATRAQLYSRVHQGRHRVEGVDYTPIGGDEMFSRLSHHAERFSRFFQLGAFRPDPSNRAPTDAFAQTIQETQPDLRLIVGRTRQVQKVTDWYENSLRRRDGEATRIGWISGPPGIGKSAFMAAVASKLIVKGAFGNHWGFYHRFQEGQTGNSLLQFLVALRESLRDWPALSQVAPALPEPVKAGAVENEMTVLAQVTDQLTAISRLAGTLPDPSGKANDAPGLIVFVDGVDECADRILLPERIRQLALPGTCWIAAGRPDFNLNEAFRSIGAEFLFGPDGLPGLTADGVRAMFFNERDELRNTIRKLDINFPGDDQVRNHFIRRVWETSRDNPGSQAGGNPQYVRLIIDDLAQQRYTVREVVDNPRLLTPGLAAAYDRILQRLGMTDSSTLLPLIAAWLAMAYEPLPSGLFVRLLARARPLLSDVETGVREAIGWGRSLLLPLPTPEETDGWTIQHQSFRDHVRTTGWINRTRQECASALLRLIEEWREQPADESGATSGAAYLLRHGLRHLLNMDLPAARASLTALAADAGYLERKLAAHQSAAQDDFTGFLDDLYDVHSVLGRGAADEQAVSGVMGSRMLEALLRTHLRAGRSLDTEDIHALLIYRKPTHDSGPGFYSQLLTQVRDDAFWQRLAAELDPDRLQQLRVGFLAKSANALRRQGPDRFAEAEALLEDCVNRLAARTGAGDSVALRELSRVEYDLGYVSALRGNLEAALESFERSAVTAERANHIVGAWVSRCIGAVFRFYRDQDANTLLDTLHKALAVFQEQADAHGNVLAKRWVANVWIHAFSASYQLGNPIDAKMYLDRALDDPWLRQVDWLVRATQLRGEPRLLALAGRYDEAFALFDAQLAEPDFRNTESAAEHYWDYGTLLERGGRPGDARRLWARALEELPPENGNIYWLERMRARLSSRESP